MNQIIEWSAGNPGALTFLMEFMKPENAIHGISILPKLEKMESIRGTNLYVLWSDLASKDLNKVCSLVNNCPPDILEDACSRQDYSGCELVKSYLN